MQFHINPFLILIIYFVFLSLFVIVDQEPDEPLVNMVVKDSQPFSIVGLPDPTYVPPSRRALCTDHVYPAGSKIQSHRFLQSRTGTGSSEMTDSTMLWTDKKYNPDINLWEMLDRDALDARRARNVTADGGTDQKTHWLTGWTIKMFTPTFLSCQNDFYACQLRPFHANEYSPNVKKLWTKKETG